MLEPHFPGSCRPPRCSSSPLSLPCQRCQPARSRPSCCLQPWCPSMTMNSILATVPGRSTLASRWSSKSSRPTANHLVLLPGDLRLRQRQDPLTHQREPQPRALDHLRIQTELPPSMVQREVGRALGLSNHRTPRPPADDPTGPSSHIGCTFHCGTDGASTGRAAPLATPSHSLPRWCEPIRSPSPRRPPYDCAGQGSATQSESWARCPSPPPGSVVFSHS